MKGLTLIEILVTLAVLAVVIAIGLPQMTGMSSSNRLASYVNSLSGDINFARSQAINRNAQVSIVANGGNWANGWTVRVDSDPGNPIRSNGPIQAGYTINEATINAVSITFTGKGLRPRNDNAQLAFQVCVTGSLERLLDVSPVGRVSYTTGNQCT